jgi:transposase-like protein
MTVMRHWYGCACGAVLFCAFLPRWGTLMMCSLPAVIAALWLRRGCGAERFGVGKLYRAISDAVPSESVETMRRQPRRNHTPALKAKVALAAIKGDRTLAQLAEQFDVYLNQITSWKAQAWRNRTDLLPMSPKPKRPADRADSSRRPYRLVRDGVFKTIRTTRSSRTMSITACSMVAVDRRRRNASRWPTREQPAPRDCPAPPVRPRDQASSTRTSEVHVLSFVHGARNRYIFTSNPDRQANPRGRAAMCQCSVVI